MQRPWTLLDAFEKENCYFSKKISTWLFRVVSSTYVRERGLVSTPISPFVSSILSASREDSTAKAVESGRATILCLPREPRHTTTTTTTTFHPLVIV